MLQEYEALRNGVNELETEYRALSADKVLTLEKYKRGCEIHLKLKASTVIKEKYFADNRDEIRRLQRIRNTATYMANGGKEKRLQYDAEHKEQHKIYTDGRRDEINQLRRENYWFGGGKDKKSEKQCCECCNVSVRKSDFYRHCKSLTHLNNSAANVEVNIEV